MYKFDNLNQTIIGMCREIISEGTWRIVRGFKCLEIPHPILIEISDPTDRYVNISQRKWNKYLPFAESLWMALGMNDLDVLPGRYVKNLYNYSDDGRTWRGGYGPRLRAFSGVATDYDIRSPNQRQFTSGYVKTVDQLNYVVAALNRDLHTRQAIIQLGDPVKDHFDEHDEIKTTKDYPCSRILQFMIIDGALNCTLYIRSNDVLFGLSAVNITNFTLMQEYIANIIGVPVGRYYHFVNNLHAYDEHIDRIRALAMLNLEDYGACPSFQYQDRFKSVEELDNYLASLYHYEQGVFSGEFDDIINFGHDMIDDWARVFYHYKHKHENVEFINPYLNKLFNHG